MKKFCVIIMVLILAGAASAAEITWTLETVLSDTANGLEVITDGVLLTAVNEGSGTASTVNGATFQADAAGLGFPSNASGILDGSDAIMLSGETAIRDTA